MCSNISIERTRSNLKKIQNRTKASSTVKFKTPRTVDELARDTPHLFEESNSNSFTSPVKTSRLVRPLSLAAESMWIFWVVELERAFIREFGYFCVRRSEVSFRIP